jgi:hypothetical protein
MAAAEGA